jgi:hypothetical protein
VEASKPVADGPSMVGNETATHASAPAAADEKDADDELPVADDLPEAVAAPDLGQLPDAGELPLPEDDAEMIQALGDPFVDDP